MLHHDLPVTDACLVSQFYYIRPVGDNRKINRESCLAFYSKYIRYIPMQVIDLPTSIEPYILNTKGYSETIRTGQRASGCEINRIA